MKKENKVNEIEKIPIPQQVKDKLINFGLEDEEIDNNTVMLVSLYQQALKGNVTAINSIQKMTQIEEPEQSNIDLTKEVKKEEKKIKKIFDTLPEELRKANCELVHQLAFMTVTLRNLADDIAKNGVKEKYKNGSNQWGYKDRTEVKTYNNMFKNYQTALKTLNDLLQINGSNEKIAGEELIRFLNSE